MTFTRSETELRERWLTGLAAAMAPLIAEAAGLEFPPYRVTCGFPSRGGLMGKKSRVRGQCWSADASEDRHAEIFISPVEDNPRQIAAILAHEMIHAALPRAGHRGPFVRAAKAIGHVAPFTSSEATPAFLDWAGALVEAAGPYPHARLNAMSAVAAPKKQSTRMLKSECSACGYTVRLTRKWVVEVGPPHCPEHGPMDVAGMDEEDEDL